MALSTLVSFAWLGVAEGHGAVVWPPPRNAADRDLAPWNGPVPENPPSVESMTGWCPVAARVLGRAGPSSAPSNWTLSGQNGQACFWFSNGCSIGCETCDGTSRGPIPNSKDPEMKRKFNTCNNQTVQATICDRKYRTVNRDAECGADDDWYYYSPWRAPGAAPVFDSCGMAGGHKPPQGGFGGIYVNTTHAVLGDRGTEVLPEMPTGIVWEAGSVVEASWVIEANHGGGYQYRLAPKDGPLNEETFQKTPLVFVGQQSLRWGGVNGTMISFNGTYASEGTTPPGSAWVVNPIPRNDAYQTGTGFEPPCKDFGIPVSQCQGMTDGQAAVADLEIIDRVLIPEDLPAGDYVLGWRWDCEESNQIWQSCSDISVVRSKADISI